MSEQQVDLSASGPGETILPPEPAEAVSGLAEALGRPERERRDAVAAVVARWPTFLEGWARLGELARDDVEAYACYRVGYHRGLDRLRQNGWRGSQYVRRSHEGNRGFILCVEGLSRAAERIGEHDEAERCAQFVRQLDPGAG